MSVILGEQLRRLPLGASRLVWSAKGERRAGRGCLSRQSFPLTWDGLGLHSRLWHPDGPQHMGLCEMSSGTWWVAEGPEPSPGNDEPQLEHLGHFSACWHSGQGCCPAATGGAACKGLSLPLRVLLDYDLDPLYGECTLYLGSCSNGNKTLPVAQILRRGKASSACFLQQR